MKPLPRHVLSLTASDLTGRILSFLAVAYLARTLGPAAMGILALGMAILAYGSIFADAGLPVLGTRSVAAGDKDLTSLVRRILTSRLLLSVMTVIVGSGILLVALGSGTSRNVAIFYLLSLIPSALILDWLFQGLKSMTTLATGRILGMAVYLLFVLLFVSEKAGIALVPVGWIVGITSQALFLWASFRKLGSNEGEVTEPSLGVFSTIKQGIPLGIATLISQVVIQFPFIYMSIFDTAEDTGVYSVAFRVVVLLLIVDRVFYTVFFPTISRSFKEGVDAFRERFDHTFKFVSAGSLYVGILAILSSRTIFPWIFGSEFTASSGVFQLLAVYFIFTVINSTFTFALIGAEKEAAYTRSLVVGGIGFFAIMLLPVPIPSLLAAPLALGVFQALSLLVMSRELQTLIPVHLSRRIFIPILTASFLIFIFSTWERTTPVLSFVTAFIVSFPLLALASGVNKRDIQDLKRVMI